MPHLPRFEASYQCYHTISTTEGRRPLFEEPRHADILLNAIHTTGAQSAHVLAFAIMPDHLHLVLVPKEPHSLAEVMRSIKGKSSREINLASNLRGPVWQRSFFDRVVRDEAHLTTVIEYVHSNPVVAGLARRAEDYPYSSAGAGIDANVTAWLNDRDE